MEQEIRQTTAEHFAEGKSAERLNQLTTDETMVQPSATSSFRDMSDAQLDEAIAEVNDVDGSTEGSTQGSNSVESKEGTELKELKGAAILSSPFGEDVISVGDYLRHRILTEQPTARIPENLNGWYGDIDKAIRLDKRTKDDLISCIDWIYTSDGSFWRPNIRSGKKLRDKFDQMSGQAKDKATRRKK